MRLDEPASLNFVEGSIKNDLLEQEVVFLKNHEWLTVHVSLDSRVVPRQG